MTNMDIVRSWHSLNYYSILIFFQIPKFKVILQFDQCDDFNFLFETKYAMAKTIQNLIKIISCDVITYKRRDIIAQSRDLMTSSCRWLPLEVIFITSVSSRQSTKSRNKKQQIDREIKTRLICYAHKVQPVLS